ncbi:hypothetical protein P167DRAFT_533824 [Morchella conica CCBAS932]|uniref:Uncharacterized protein n=1 Tax=Morchella conica CCBAS932 TaxID=1392247 RepID=A0A3N4L001_9PEZI|nr:hypothetical protein P167DRAFT_533824 [Morchella conica CCBAS932]
MSQTVSWLSALYICFSSSSAQFTFYMYRSSCSSIDNNSAAIDPYSPQPPSRL